ncbi:protein phosphatase inhibitor 2 [Drosophila yakuba]|uniref:Protein phosphatase inhibitor 2 n=1 Tax=Drosophila yakuba TaxID=7245 RepID=B4P8T1_DROYA|nr:protein phosphatase inhibitor 2 [Drosophila yakuba]EDW90189.1 uncharacterized protein Dyak_GE13145 [Drosophila yakuba]
MDGDQVRGILKSGNNSAQFSLKAAKFDEVNILATFHPVGKDYGHMIIDEPKTPFVFEDDLPKELDTTALIEKLRLTSKSEMPAFGIDGDSEESSADEDYPESVEEKVRRMEFERRRKLHYKEFYSVPLARRLIAEEFADLTSAESSIHCERVGESCEACSESNQTIDGEGSNLTKTKSSYSVSQSDERLSDHSEPEPGFSPNHHCYQKLKAELFSKQEPEELASLTHLHRLPSVVDDEPSREPRVPYPSVIPFQRNTLQDNETSRKTSTEKSAPARICKSNPDKRGGTSKKETR